MMTIPQYISKVLNILNNNGYEGYLVGGCVRDTLMGKEPHDFDLTTNALPGEIISCFEEMKIIETGLKHGTVTVVSEGENVEITTYRIDGKYTDNRHPEKVSFTRNIHEDLSRRDFTVNAIAYSPYDGIVDIFGGRDDIKSEVIRCVGCPDTRFNEDGLRIMRAVRFASVLSFSIDDKTSESIHKNRELLKNISAERIYSELKKLLSGKKAADVLKEYYDVLCVVFPALEKYKAQYMKNVDLIKDSPNDSVSRFVCLLYGMDASDIKSSLRCLKPDNYLYDNVKILSECVLSHVDTDEISVRYIMNKLSPENIERLAGLKKLFYPEFEYDNFIEQYKLQLEKNACVRIKDLALGGNDLIELGIKKGPRIGEIMNQLLKAVIENKCSNNREELKNYVFRYFIYK